MKIRVYYEALCPDSKHFFIKHLGPVTERLSDFIDVSLVPYGKATVSSYLPNLLVIGNIFFLSLNQISFFFWFFSIIVNCIFNMCLSVNRPKRKMDNISLIVNMVKKNAMQIKYMPAPLRLLVTWHCLWK